MLFDLWYHDGTGQGWPALETSRRVERVQIFDAADNPLHNWDGSEVWEERIYRNLIVCTAGEAAAKKAGLKAGDNYFLDVPEGAPHEKGTCSHIAWQPGTREHMLAIVGDLEGEELAARVAEHGFGDVIR